MIIDNPLFLIPFLCGILFLIAGLIMLYYPPKNINGLYGYRTESSMKSKERWDFAQHYSAIELIKVSILLILLSLIGIVYYPPIRLALILAFAILFVLFAGLFYRVEKKIKKQWRT